MFAENLRSMKVNFISTLAFAAMATFFIACDDQSESKYETPIASSIQSGEISIDGHSARAKAGILQYSTVPVTSTSYYRHELGLVTEGFTAQYDETEGLMLQGEGTGIWITLNSPSSALEPGTYTFSGSQSSADAFDFWYGSVDAKGKNYLFTSGEMTVVETSGLYTITVDGTVTTVGSSAQKHIKATYSGALRTFKSK
jgi:hypothetical protein